MKISMPFKPKAQILLQLGEQLIKSESIAILELVKNSYDADATIVSVCMNDIDNPETGVIVITDNGSGMDIDTVMNVWMEPGNTHKREIVSSQTRSSLGRLPIGEKGIGRFGVHKLGKKIEMISKASNHQEVVVRIDWRSFENEKYLEDVLISIEEREPQEFVDDQTGTKIVVSDLSCVWTRGMLRDVYRAITSLSSPFKSIDSFRVKFITNKRQWLDGLISFEEIKDYALYTGQIRIEGDSIKSFSYHFRPFNNMSGIKPREYLITTPIKMVIPSKNKGTETQIIDLNRFMIGPIVIDLMVFDRDSSLKTRFISDKRTYGQYLDDNGGIRVFRDEVRIYDYGEPGDDWLELDSKRINYPGKHLSNNLVLGSVQLKRDFSADLQEKANREGFIENKAFWEFKNAVVFAIDLFTAQRNIDKETLRVYLTGGPKEPVVKDISGIRKLIQKAIPSEKDRAEVDKYLKQIEGDYVLIKNQYLKTASAGMSYGIVIHEIEKVIGALNEAVKREVTSKQIKNLAKHLSKLIGSYSELLRNRSRSKHTLSSLVNQAEFSIQYRLEAHNIHLKKDIAQFGEYSVYCSSNLIVGSLINIIDNSIWWTTYAEVPERKILIKVTDEIDGHLAIVVADNGCGFSISAEDAIKPFVSTKSGGMGLGLNIVNEIMLSQNGTLAFPDYGDIDLPKDYQNGAIVALVFKEISR